MFIALQSEKVQTYASRKVLEFLSDNFHTKFTVDQVEIKFFNRVSLKNLYIEDLSGDTLLFAGNLTANIGKINTGKKKLTIQKVTLDHTFFNLYQDSSGTINIKYLLGRKKEKNQEKAWDIDFKSIKMGDSRFSYSSFDKKETGTGINFSDLDIYRLNIDVKRLKPKGDTISFIIKSLSCIEKSGFVLDQLTAKTSICSNHMTFEDVVIRTPLSRIEGNRMNMFYNTYSDFKTTTLYSHINFDLSVTSSEINLNDLAYFAPVFSGSEQIFRVSGDMKGPLDNITAKKLEIEFGNSSSIAGEIEVDGLPDINETFIYAKFNHIETDYEDVLLLQVPGNRKIAVPALFKEMGIITYSGQFTGFFNDFVAYGTINSNLGLVKTDILIKPDKKERISLSGSLVTERFNLGKLLKQETEIGNISMNIKANGYIPSDKNVYALISGEVNLLELKGYPYKNIGVAGELNGKKFDGEVSVKDQNLDLDFHGLIDFSGFPAQYDFFASVAHANLYRLNLDKSDPQQTVSFDVTAKASGNNLNDIRGEVNLINSLFAKKDRQIQIYGAKLTADDTLGMKKISLRSDFADLDVKGNFQIEKAGTSFRKFLYNFLPALVDSGKIENIDDFKNSFHLSARLKNTKPVFDFFLPGFSIGTNSVLEAGFEPDSNDLMIFFRTPLFTAKQFTVDDLTLNVQSNDSVLNIRSSSQNVSITDKFNFENLSFASATSSGNSFLVLKWDNNDSVSYKGTVEAGLSFEPTLIPGKPAVVLNILPAKFTAYDSVWNLNACELRVENKNIEINNVHVEHNGQFINLFGKISDDPADKVIAEFQNFNLGIVNQLIYSSGFKLEGVLNGNAVVSGVYSNPYFSSELQIDSLIINDERLGDLSVSSKWDNEEKSIGLDVQAKRGNLKTIDLSGTYYPQRQGMLNFDLELDKLRLNIFEPYVKTLATNLKGLATGNMKILGTIKKPLFNGELLLQKTAFRVNYLNTQYYFTHQVNVTDNNVYLRDLIVFDEEGHRAIVNGSVTNTYFRNFRFDLGINADNFHFLNTRQSDNSQFYGTAYASGLVKIWGSPKNITMDITAKTERNTRIFIPLSSQEEIVEYNFVSFTPPGEATNKEFLQNGKYQVNLSGIQMNFDLDVTPDAEVQLIFDPTVGDILKGRGSGNIKMQISTLGKFTMFGNYIVEEGDYRFTLMNFINRTFDIEPGGEIRWSGSPLDAEINMKAVYETKTSLNTLFGTTESETENTAKATTIHCIIQMSEKLMSPKIKFDFEFPYAEEETKTKIANVLNSNDDITYQFIALLVTGKFVIPGQQNGSSPYSNVAGGNASEFLSNQLSHWLSQINNNVDVSVNLRNDELKRNYVETALSTQVFNDKLTIYGNLGIPTNAAANASSNIVGDVDLDYKITPSGKIRVKAFNHSNEEYDPSKPYTQGVGFVYKEEFNTMGELWRRYWKSIFGSGKSKETVSK